MMMKALVNICVVGMLTLVATSEGALAQSTATAEARLKELNITLPSVPPPVANYVDAVRVGNLLFLAVNTAAPDWKFKGKVGKDLTVQEGYDTARQVGLIMLAKVRAALGSLDRVKRVVKVLGMVNSADGVGDQPRACRRVFPFNSLRNQYNFPARRHSPTCFAPKECRQRQIRSRAKFNPQVLFMDGKFTASRR